MCGVCESAATVLQAAEELTRACIDSVAGAPGKRRPAAKRLNRAFKVDPSTPAAFINLLEKMR